MEQLKDLIKKLEEKCNYLVPSLLEFLNQEAKDVNFVVVNTFKGSAANAPMFSYRNSVYINKSKFVSSIHSIFILIHEIGHVKQFLREGEKIYDVWTLEFEEAFNKVLEIERDADDYAVLNTNKILRDSYVLLSTHNANSHRQNFNNDIMLKQYKVFIKDIYDTYQKSDVNILDPEKSGFI